MQHMLKHNEKRWIFTGNDMQPCLSSDMFEGSSGRSEILSSVQTLLEVEPVQETVLILRTFDLEEVVRRRFSNIC